MELDAVLLIHPKLKKKEKKCYAQKQNNNSLYKHTFTPNPQISHELIQVKFTSLMGPFKSKVQILKNFGLDQTK